jgi:predicted nucleic acid-binding protein
MKIIIDTSVVISAIKSDEKFHNQSLEFLEQVREYGDEIWTPMTQLWEIGSALDHPGKTLQGTKFHKFEELNMQFVTVDQGLFQRTWKPDLRVAVKAADRVFLSCALDKGAELISWDDNLVRNAGAFGVNAQTPETYLKNRPRKA